MAVTRHITQIKITPKSSIQESLESCVINHIADITYDDMTGFPVMITGIQLAKMYNQAFFDGRQKIFQVVVNGPSTSHLTLFCSQPYYSMEVDPWDYAASPKKITMSATDFINFFEKYAPIKKLPNGPEPEEQSRCVIS